MSLMLLKINASAILQNKGGEEMFLVRCYNKYGGYHHSSKTDTLEKAEIIRRNWGTSIGLAPEPSMDFAKYPTIWKYNGGGDPDIMDSYERMPGY